VSGVAHKTGSFMFMEDIVSRNSQASVDIRSHFETLTDPRRREPTYPLENMVVMLLCGVICGADDFVAITAWANTKKDWLAKFLDMSAGVPSHDRFNAVVALLRPREFEQCLLNWITALHEITGGQIIAIDGKTLRRSYDKGSGKAAIHMVSAWASANHISLGQVTTDEKSNEITAIPQLLKLIETSGSLVTIDAMGCQTAIAEQIVQEGADYCLAVKGNQPTLHAGIKAHFQSLAEADYRNAKARHTSTHEKGHGRIEDRYYTICPVPESLGTEAQRWASLKAIGMTTNVTWRDGEERIETRYYILSKYIAAKRFAEAVRSHWSIENNLHWQLDVTFGEDQCRVRKDHADENLSLLRRTALSLLKNEKTAKVGIKNKRLKAGWDESYLAKVMFGT
jgi:predicted transposase YbfD/YdcC